MYHHPWITSIGGILANIIVLTTIILISSTRFLTVDKEEERSTLLNGRSTDMKTTKRTVLNGSIEDIKENEINVHRMKNGSHVHPHD